MLVLRTSELGRRGGRERMPLPYRDTNLDADQVTQLFPVPGIYCNTGCRTGNIRVLHLVCFV